EQIFGMSYTPQVSDETNDTVYYELGKFIELLTRSNPNILELLATPEDKILYKHPVMDMIKPGMFISKKCKDSFGGYAFTQVRRARGLNKKIVNPVGKEKKNILEFCHVLHGHGSIPLTKWLALHNFQQEFCGLVNIPHAKDLYAVFYDENKDKGFKGILKKENATTVLLSSIPKEEESVAYLHFNKDGFSKYCKDYKGYWDWVENRNEARYQNNIDHGKNYDSKNMMHTFRLLDMAIEILSTGTINVKRPNREELLIIRRGEAIYDDLIERAEEKMKQVEEAYAKSTLQEEPNVAKAEELLVQMRKEYYI
ncbi:MAG: hypothetical protein ACI9VN_003845, partial [Patescibacteria group bacterium]